MYSSPSHYCDWIPDKKQLNGGLNYFRFNMRVQLIVEAKTRWWEKVLAMVVEVWGSWSHSCHGLLQTEPKTEFASVTHFLFCIQSWSKFLGRCTYTWAVLFPKTNFSEMSAICLVGDSKSRQVDNDESPSHHQSQICVNWSILTLSGKSY